MDTYRWTPIWILLPLLVSMTSGQSSSRRRVFGDGAARRRLNIVTLQSDPYVRLKWAHGLIGNERYEGYFKDLISRLADLAGFDYRLHLVADGKLGQEGEDGAWDGMVGKIIAREADLTLGPLSIFRERQNVVEFTSPIEEVQLTVLMSKPEGSEARREMSPSELLSRSDIMFAALRESDTVRALMTSSDPTLRSLYRRLLQQNTPAFMANMYEALEYVRREGFALLLDSGMADYHIGREPCDLRRITTFPGERHYALAARKEDPIIGELNRAIENLKSQGGSWLQLKRNWWQSQCPGITFETLGLPQMKTNKDVINKDEQTTSSQPMMHLRITSQLSPPFVIAPAEDGGKLTGYTIDLLDHVSQIVPFTYDVTFPRDNKGFGKRRRGHWTGMTGELLRDEKDLAAAPFTSDHQRDRVLIYTKPFLHSTLSILTKVSSSEDEIPIFFMEDLLNQTEYKYGVLRGSHLERALKHSNEEIPRNIWRNILKDKRNNVVRTLEDGVRKVRTEKFAFILPSTYATYLSSKGPCDLMALDQFMFITNYMFAVKMDNLLVEKIDEALIKLQQDGVLQMLFHKWWNTGDCLGATEPAKVFEDGFNATVSPQGGQSSRDWFHELLTFSTKWKNPLASPTPPSLKVGNTSRESASSQSTSSLDSLPGPSTEVQGNGGEAVDHEWNHAATKTKVPPMTYTVPTTPYALAPTAKPERNQHRHRHRHRDGNRRKKKNRRKNRKRNRENIESTTVGEIVNASEPMVAKSDDILLIPVGLTSSPSTESSSQPPTSTLAPPPPAKWDGKYIFGDLYSTREPSNYSLDIELEAESEEEEESIRIFPFTYRPKVKTDIASQTDPNKEQNVAVTVQGTTLNTILSSTEGHDVEDYVEGEYDYDYDESGSQSEKVENDDDEEEEKDISIDEDFIVNEVVVVTSLPTQIYTSFFSLGPTKPSETSGSSCLTGSQIRVWFITFLLFALRV